MTNAVVRVPSLEEAEVVKLVNGPEAFTPDGEFILGETDVRGFWVAAGLLRARPRRRGRNGAAGRRMDRRGRPEPRRLGDGLPPLRRGVPEPRVHARAHARDLLHVLRRQVPGPRAPGGAAATGLAGLRAPARARRRVRREVGLGARELVRAQRRARRRVAPPARLGRAPLVAGDRRGAPRVPRGRRALRRDLVRQARRARAGRGRLPGTPLRQPRRPRRRRGHLHADAERARRASSATSRSRASPRTASGS